MNVTDYTAVLTIPTQQGVPFYTQRTALDGRDYTLRFAWNQRAQRMYLDLLDATKGDAPILVGLKLITNWPLLRAYHARPGVPPGELGVLTKLADTSPPGLNDLGVGLRCELVYLSKAKR